MLRTVFGLVVLLALIEGAFGQQQSTIQLPTFNFTTVNTTVSVPDGGTGLLGGIMRASEGSTTRGVPLLSKIPGLNRLFTNQGIGRDVGLSNMTVSPRIIIQEEEEFLQTGVTPELLSQHAPGVAVPVGGFANVADPEVARKANFLAANVARQTQPEAAAKSSYNAKTPSVAEVRRQNAAARDARLAEAKELFAKGQQAEAEGKAGVAKVYYQMAGLRADGDLLSQIAARLAALPGPAKGPKLAGR